MGISFGHTLRVVRRGEWGGREPRHVTPLPRPPVSDVVLHHTGGEECDNHESCTRLMRKLQNDHMDERGHDDIKYNFLVGGDGRVYEGRGWGVQAEHLNDPDYDEETIGICLIGRFHKEEPSEAMLQAVRGLMYFGVRKGHLTQGPKLQLWPHVHFDSECYCPGLSVLDIYFNEVVLQPNEYWTQEGFLAKLWNKIWGEYSV